MLCGAKAESSMPRRLNKTVSRKSFFAGNSGIGSTAHAGFAEQPLSAPWGNISFRARVFHEQIAYAGYLSVVRSDTVQGIYESSGFCKNNL